MHRAHTVFCPMQCSCSDVPTDQGVAGPLLPPVAPSQFAEPAVIHLSPAPLLPPIHPPHDTPSLFFFRNCPVLTHVNSRSVQGENETKYKLKSQTPTYCLFCFSEVIGFESGNVFTYSDYCFEESAARLGRGQRPVFLTAPGRRCPAGRRSGPPSRSPPAAAPWG